jgi:hypothetical protein
MTRKTSAKEAAKVAMPVAALVVSIAAIAVSLYTFHGQLATANKHMEINLSRDLLKEFFSGNDQSDLYRRIRTAVERCRHVYKSWGGEFDNDDVNRYLGFFEDLGLYRDQGVLSLEIVGHGFGSYIVEAWEYPEFRRYIDGLRKAAKQEKAFQRFERLAKEIEADPARRLEVERARSACKSLTRQFER